MSDGFLLRTLEDQMAGSHQPHIIQKIPDLLAGLMDHAHHGPAYSSSKNESKLWSD